MLHAHSILLITNDISGTDPEKEIVPILLEARANVEVVRDFREITSDMLAKHYDVLLFDMQMDSPVSSSLEMLRYIQECDKNLPILGLFASESEQAIMRALSNGVQDYLVKGQSTKEVIIRAIRYAVQRKRYEEKIAYLTMQDHLTGLMNGDMIPSTLKQAINSAKREKSLVAVYFVDIDNFKDINDAYGHNVGNALLIDIASRLQNVVDDDSVLARLSADTFVVIDIADDLDVCAVLAQEIVSAMRVKTHVGSLELQISASIGVATYPECGSNAIELIKNAEQALNLAKKNGKGSYRFFSQELNEEATKRIHITTALKEMVNDEMFSLYYQPKIDLATDAVSGVEALIRWNHPVYGFIAPDQFIPLAEEAGLIQNVSTWVVNTACIQHRHSHFSSLDMAVNISAKELCSPDIVKLIRHVLDETLMDANRLVIEITETAMFTDSNLALSTMHQLKELGVQLYIDDFGIGYSSIDYLRRYPVDALKIDRSFVMQMDERPDDMRVVKLMIDIAHELDLVVIAEGVEKEEQAMMLKGMHCNAAQGYFYGKPMPAEQFVEWYDRYTGTKISKKA